MPQTQITAAVAIIVTGCIIAGVGDLAFNPLGYIYALSSCLCQAAYLLCIEFQVRPADR